MHLRAARQAIPLCRSVPIELYPPTAPQPFCSQKHPPVQSCTSKRHGLAHLCGHHAPWCLTLASRCAPRARIANIAMVTSTEAHTTPMTGFLETAYDTSVPQSPDTAVTAEDAPTTPGWRAQMHMRLQGNLTGTPDHVKLKTIDPQLEALAKMRLLQRQQSRIFRTWCAHCTARARMRQSVAAY